MRRRLPSFVLVGMFVLAFLVPSVASADSPKLKFSMEAPLAFVGLTQLADPTLPPTDTQASFKLSHGGKVNLVRVHTDNELVVAPITAPPDCSDPSDPFCGPGPGGVVGARIVSLHSSDVMLINPTLLTSGLAPYPNGLAGHIVGELESAFSIIKTDPIGNTIGAMTGAGRLRIEGEAVFVCVVSLNVASPFFLAPTPGGINDCQSGNGKLVPISVDVLDSGKFEIDTAAGVFAGIEEVEGRIAVTAVASPAGVAGDVSIKGRLERD